MSLITPAELRVFAPHLMGTTDDARLVDAIDAADALAARLCGFPAPDDGGDHTLQAQTYTVFGLPSPLDERRLMLGIRPILEVVSVHVSATWTYGAADLVDTDDVVTDGSALMLKPTSASVWSSVQRANRVVVRAGVDPVPPDLRQTIARLALHLLGPGADETTTLSAGGQSASRTPLSSAVPDPIAARLMGWRLVGTLAA